MEVNKPQWARRVRSRAVHATGENRISSRYTRGGEFAIIGEGEDLIKNSSQARAHAREREREFTERTERA